jgi:serine/threonine protein kinase
VSTESPLAYRRGGYFQIVVIRAFPNSGGIGLLQALAGIQHPNVAKVYDVYCYDNKIFTVSEYLELSLVDLEFQSFPFEEWEIATIIAEV